MNLDNEQMTLLNNILSLLKEIMQTGDEVLEPSDLTEGAPAEFSLLKEDNIEEGPEEESNEDDLKKDLTSTESEGATANDDAEERIEDPEPEASQANMQEVAKMLQMFKKINTVKKSKKINPSTRVLNELVKTTKSIANKQKITDEALINVLKGLGIADEIEKANNIQAEVVTKGFNDTADVNKTLEYLANAIKGNENKEETLRGDNMGEVRKSFRNVDFLKGLIEPK